MVLVNFMRSIPDPVLLRLDPVPAGRIQVNSTQIRNPTKEAAKKLFFLLVGPIRERGGI